MAETQGPRRQVVIDTNAVVRGVNLTRLFGYEVYTIPEVLEEILDQKSKQLISTLPFDIKTKEPGPEEIKEVTEFAKKTGDIAVLSKTDIKVIALTLQLDREANPDGIVDDHVDELPAEASDSESESGSESEEEDDDEEEDQQQQQDEEDGWEVPKLTARSKKPLKNTKPNLVAEILAEQKLEQEQQQQSVTPSVSAPSVDVEQPSTAVTEQTPVESAPVQSDPATTTDTAPVTAAVEDDGEGEWITPSNVAKIKARDLTTTQVVTELPGNRVGVVTTDFAMQNVIVQMRLILVSLDGMVIRRLRQFVLQCDTCWKLTRQMDKIFCPSCGNHTMIRVSVWINKDGMTRVAKLRRSRTRGTKYALPVLKGGRTYGSVLNEDELIRFGRRELPEDMKVGVGKKNRNAVRHKPGRRKKHPF